ncbi:unnamed protein product [Psylliodes chrysocephalus]|uniref:Uncharacterized protein n=1 Tax=Psylliodes chrysocephalus TaxID=3402493 RepID=A0A9P0GKY1_9CUCU|nr:unnamed protein product [Psylliodes chrysocephala]
MSFSKLQVYKELRHNKFLVDSALSLLLCFLITIPAFENNLSAGTLVAEIPNKSRVIFDRDDKNSSLLSLEEDAHLVSDIGNEDDGLQFEFDISITFCSDDSFNYVPHSLLVFESRVLASINLVSKQLQSSTFDIGRACDLIRYAKQNTLGLTENFNDYEKEACNLAKSWDIEPKLTSKRQKKIKMFFDELVADSRIEDSLRRFQIQIFNESLDIIINQLTIRYISMKEVMKHFSFLTPALFVELTNDKIVRYSDRLLRKYESDFPKSLAAELRFKADFSYKIRNKKTKKTTN